MFSTNEISEAFNISQADMNVAENIKQFSVSFVTNKLINTDLLKCILAIPTRDSIRINIKYVDEHEISLEKGTKIEELNDFIQSIKPNFDGDDDETLDINIEIRKTVYSGLVTIYDYAVFSKWLFEQSVSNFLCICHALKKSSPDQIIFECVNDKIYLRSGYICIKTKESVCPKPIINDLDRSTIIEKRKEMCNILSDSINFIPSDFEFYEGNVSQSVCLYIKKIRFILSVMYLTDQSELRGNKLNFTMNGFRLVSESINLEELVSYN